MLARISLSTSNLDGTRVAPNRGISSRTRPCTSSCLERFPLRGHPLPGRAKLSRLRSMHQPPVLFMYNWPARHCFFLNLRL